MIHIADQQTDIILDDITEDAFWQDSHKKSLVNMQETFNFITFADKSFSEFLSKRNRIIIPDEDGQLIEFVITNTRKYRTNGALKCDVYTSAHYVTLQTAKVIQPHVTGADSAETHAINALAGTEFEVGTIAFKGVRTLTFEEHTNPYKYLKKIASEFDLELHFRVESDGIKITKRYVDLVERVGNWRGREVELGKDLEGIERKEDFSNIATALVGLGPMREDGTRLEVLVENEEALQRWGRNGQHIIATYEPQSTDLEMTEARLIELTENELEKRINSVVQYKADIIDLEKVIGLEHEKIRFGDTIKIKDTKFNPPLYLEARVHTQDRSIKRKGKKTVELGDYIEYTEEQVNAIWKTLQQQIANKISMSQLTEATYTKTEIDTKDNVVQSNAATDASNKANQAETNAKEHADSVASDAETAAKQHANQLKAQVDAELLNKAGLEYVNGQLVLKADQSQVDTIESELNGAILDIADKADISYVDGQLVLKANQSQVDGLVQDIADKADLTYVNGQLTSKADKADTYTITQVDNALNSKVSTTQYTTDINGIVTDLNDHESRITQTETDITSKVSSTQYNQDISAIQGDISTLETTVGNHTTSINQNASAISLKANATDVYTKTQVDTSLNNKADATTVNAIETRVSEAEAELIVQAGQIASKVSQTEYDADINGVVTRLDSAESSITQNANEISQRVTTTTYNAGMASKEDTVYKQSSAPAHANGRLWLNTSVTPNILYRSTGSTWVKATPTTASEVGAYSSSAGNSLASRVTTAESNITQNANAITLKASQSALDNLANDVTSVSNQVSSLQVSVNGITADVSSLESTVNGHTTDISSLNSQLTVQAGQIASKVDATYVTGAIADIDLGGLNLFSVEDFKVNKYTDEENDSLISWRYQGTPHQKYTVSTNIPMASSTTYDLFFGSYPFTASSSSNGVAINEPRTVTAGSNGIVELTFRSNKVNGTIEGTFVVKLEAGVRATDWTPAPKDLQSEIDSVYSYAESEINQLAGQISLKADSSTVNSINTRLSSAEVDINALEGAITSKVESSTFNALEGRVDTAESTITQTAQDVQFAFNNIDSINNKLDNAVTTIDATGISVANGSFFLVDENSNTKSSIVHKDNLIWDHSFELLYWDSSTLSIGYAWANMTEPEDGGTPYWRRSGAPKVGGVVWTGNRSGDSEFGNQHIAVNNVNFVYTIAKVNPSTTYALSAFFKRQYASIPGGQPRLEVRRAYPTGSAGELIASQTFPVTTTDYTVQRPYLTFTTPSNLAEDEGIFIYIKSANSNYVHADGVQLVEGNYPTIYNAEDYLWKLSSGSLRAKMITSDRLTTYRILFDPGNASAIYYNESSGRLRVQQKGMWGNLNDYHRWDSNGNSEGYFEGGIMHNGYAGLNNTSGSYYVAYQSNGAWYKLRAGAADSVQSPSLESIKENIQELPFDSLQEIANSKIYQWNYIDDVSKESKVGLVIGRETSPHVLTSDKTKVDGLSMTSMAWDAIKQLVIKQRELEARITYLEENVS